MNRWVILVVVLLNLTCIDVGAVEHPNLLLTKSAVAELRAARTRTPMLDVSIDQAIVDLESLMGGSIDVPMPKDGGGGYTHERHKKNGQAIYQAGVLYQLSGDRKYLLYAQELLTRYATLYPGLGPHPEHKHQAPGKLFWQILNDAVWLVYAIQGYDSIVAELDDKTRKHIEENLLRPYVRYLTVDSADTFTKVHNHGTWAAAAVGMTGLVLNDSYMVDIALNGLRNDGSSGFLKQLDVLFSPDGYYTEGPYYQRYALMPFLVFARALNTKEPTREIFKYRNSILMKAIYASINLSYNNLFFPLNDAIKDKGLDTIEMVYGVDIAFGITGDTGLLSLAKKQGQVLLTRDGLKVAQAIELGLSTDFNFTSQLLHDGPTGQDGAIAILRAGNSALLFKAASQGMGHGHFDRLSWLYYDNGVEIVSDYGAARFLNVETKNGGVYLPENESWAKQTVAHNTLVVDGQSHFGGDVGGAALSSPKLLAFSVKEDVQLVAAEEASAYSGVRMQRTMALVKPSYVDAPLVIDLMEVFSKGSHQYDLPLNYQGQITNVLGDTDIAITTLKTLGKSAGYQHLWNKGQLTPIDNTAQITWLKNNRFYSLTQWMPKGAQLIFAELGANDPQFNLRRENSFIVRYPAQKSTQFLSVLETHGEYNGIKEFTLQPRPNLASALIENYPGCQVVVLKFKAGERYRLYVAADRKDSQHECLDRGNKIRWTGVAFGVEEK